MTALAAPARFNLGSVLSRTFDTVGANFPTFFLLAFLLAALPNLLIGLARAYVVPLLAGQMDRATFAMVGGLTSLGAAIVAMIPGYLLMGAITHASIAHYSGGRASLGEALGTSLNRIFPLLGLGILTIIGAILWMLPLLLAGAFAVGISAATFGTGAGPANGFVGFILGIVAVVPAVFALLRWSVSAPSLVVERTGVFEAFRRSGDLTRRNRWWIFLLLVIWAVLVVAIQWALQLVNTTATTIGIAAVSFVVYYSVNAFYSAISATFLAAGQAALYYELRSAKEGVRSDELAKVFD